MLDRITNGIVAIVKDDDIKNLSKKSLLDFVNIVLNKELFASTLAHGEFAIDIKKLLWQIPNAIFWDKMYRFMIGTYSNYEYQIKMCEKFHTDNKQFKQFVKKQIQIIEKLDFDDKVNWFSNLTRAFLLELIDEHEYFNFSFALRMISTENLTYLKKIITMNDVKENSILSLFYQHSLVNKFTPTTYGSSTSEYNISDAGIKLLKYGIDVDNCDKYQ
ncbi:MAG: hypothetical protein E7638_07455 [Ruminococcaceae bacterium]|nr:hypothetical protein [Oscillospiraceae bacterium]